MTTPFYAKIETVPLLTTKLYVPPPRPDLVSRPRLIQRLDDGLRLRHKLTLVSAPAGYGKTTLVSEWIHLGVKSAEYGVRGAERADSPVLTPNSLLPTPYSSIRLALSRQG